MVTGFGHLSGLYPPPILAKEKIGQNIFFCLEKQRISQEIVRKAAL